MSARRRARAAVTQNAADAVPAALYDYRDEAWASVQSARAWCAAVGVPTEAIRDSGLNGYYSPAWRRMDALDGWAETNGYMSGAFPDWRRLAALGLADGSPTGPDYVTEDHR